MNLSWNRPVKVVTAGALVLLASVGTARPAGAQASGVELVAEINGVDLADADDPIDLDPDDRATIHVEVTNGGDEDIEVRDVVVEGIVMGIPFLAYDIDVNLDVAAGATEDVNYEVPLRGVSEQALGLLPATLAIHDGDGDRIADVDFTVDVAGSSTSLFALFGYFLALVTVASFAFNLWLVVRRRLPPNRLTRAGRFAITGLGLGLTLTVTLAAARFVTPTPGAWVPLVLVPVIAAMALGYVSPGPLAAAWPEDEVDVAFRERETVRSGGGA